MIGKIEEIQENSVIIKLNININEQPNLINLHLVFEDGPKKIVAEIMDVNQTIMKANIVGEIENDHFITGASSKPSFKSTIRLVRTEELELLYGKQQLEFGYTNVGRSNVYQGYRINVRINDFFNSHFAIIGNTGSGKSSTIASMIQNLYTGPNKPPVNSALFFFDAYGEYTRAFEHLHEQRQELNYKAYTTNLYDQKTELLKIPIWLLDVDDLALLLDANSPMQLPIIEKTLKLVPILTGSSEMVIQRKNDIIARALQDILLSGMDSTKIRDQVVGVLTKFNTPTLNLESQIVQPGYTRSFKQCLFIDKTGKMQEMELVVEFVRAYIMDEMEEIPEEELNPFYTLADLEMAMEFALISEGVLKSDRVFDTANIMNVRLHSISTGENRHFFTYPKYVTRSQYIENLLYNEKTLGRCQIINFNINYVDDRMAKVITKIISRMLFQEASDIATRGKRSYNIVIEEAHRYVQKDNDHLLLGYNVFERIAKEGRKYGVFLSLITQRPSELSETCVSQCSNFIILRTVHPKDLEYIQSMIPSVSKEVMMQLKTLKPGNCIAFGSAFKVPTFMYMDEPNPKPDSTNVNLEEVWYQDAKVHVAVENTVMPVPQAEDINQMMAQQVGQTESPQVESQSQELTLDD